jgi:hypothetical protein
VTVTWLGRPLPIELTADPGFAGRVRRLAAISATALGVLLGLAIATLAAPWPVDAALAAGWLLMPTVLIASLARARLRVALVVPSSLVSVGLLAIVLLWRPDDPVAATGWLLLTAGVLLGGVLGLWLWYRLAPVPRALDAPYANGRWALIAIHAGLVLAGLALVAGGALAG